MTEPLSDRAVEEALRDLPGWTREGNRLCKEFRLKDFRAALGFVLEVGFLAEGMDHHPDISILYRRVVLALRTHDAGDRITTKDLELARRVEARLGSKE